MNGFCHGDSEEKVILKDNKKHDQVPDVSEESELKTFLDKDHEALDKPEEERVILKDNKKHDHVSEESELKTYVDKEHEALDKPEEETPLELESGKWIAVKYDKDWHIGKIQEVDSTDKDCLISFMQRQKCKWAKEPTFKWPNHVDELWVKFDDVLQCIDEPSKVGRSARSFSITEEEISTIELKLALKK